jgi:hypothetical protein
MTIQGEMMDPHSRLKERHEEKKVEGKERREKARRPEIEKGRTAVELNHPFSRLENRRGRL